MGLKRRGLVCFLNQGSHVRIMPGSRDIAGRSVSDGSHRSLRFASRLVNG